MTRALILGLALFCGKLMADPCDDLLIQTAGDYAQQQALSEATQNDLNGWTATSTANVVRELQAGSYNVLEIQVPVVLTYPGQPDSPYNVYSYYVTVNLLNRQISFSTQQEVDYAVAMNPPPAPVIVAPQPVYVEPQPVYVEPQPVVVSTDQVAMDFANQYAASYTFFRSVVGLTMTGEVSMGFVSQYTYIANISNGDTVQIVFQIDGNGTVTHISSFEI